MNKYLIMYNNIPVVEFDAETEKAKIIHPHLIPFGEQNIDAPWDIVKSFCSDRILRTNRKHFSEILASCMIDNQSTISICTTSKALSFRDNYWIKELDSDDNWNKVNLYTNEFSNEIAHAAITGEKRAVHIGNSSSTGELTGLGTRAKCFYRGNDNNIYLFKAETDEEIGAEILSSMIANAFALPCAYYSRSINNDIAISICKLDTSKSIEMLPGRDILKHFNDNAAYPGSKSFEFLIKSGKTDFIKLLLFDAFTLNTDRNRDNYALKKQGGVVTGMYPIFDHDACFRGKSLSGINIMTGVSFKETLQFLHDNYMYELVALKEDIKKLLTYVKTKEFKEQFIILQDDETYSGFVSRIEEELALI